MAVEKRYRVIWKDASSTDTMDISNGISLDANDSIKDTADIFRFIIGNKTIDSNDTSNANLQGRRYSQIFDVGDKLELYIGQGSSIPSNLIMGGYISEDDINTSNNNSEVTIKGANKLEKLLSALQDISEENKKASDIVVKAVSNTNDLNTNLKIAGGLWNSQHAEATLTLNSQTFNTGSGLNTSIASGFKGGTNGNITITVYNDTSIPDVTFLGGNASIVFTVNGIDKNSKVISDTITITSSDQNRTKATTKTFDTITSVTHPAVALTITNNKIVIGTGGVQVSTKTIVAYPRPSTQGFRIIDEVSKDTFTGNGSYLYYLTNEDVLVWKQKDTATSSKITKGENTEWGTVYTDYTPAMTMRVRRGAWDLINSIILLMGTDFDGTKLRSNHFSAKSVLTVGWKEKSEVIEHITNNIKKNHPLPSSYPGGTEWGPNSKIVSNDADVNAELKAVMKVIGEGVMNKIIEANGIVRYKINAILEYTDNIFNSFFKGDLVKILNEDIVTNDQPWDLGNEKLMRINNVAYVMTRANIIMKVELIEDEETAIAQYDVFQFNQ